MAKEEEVSKDNHNQLLLIILENWRYRYMEANKLMKKRNEEILKNKQKEMIFYLSERKIGIKMK